VIYKGMRELCKSYSPEAAAAALINLIGQSARSGELGGKLHSSVGNGQLVGEGP
jgi:hypothetical protein